MASPAHRLSERFTWSDYRTWPDDERWEIIGGEAFAMSPSPTTRHQIISREVAAALHGFFKGKLCQFFSAPMDVKLSDEDVVQPDLLVVCDPKQILRTHIEGPPTLVVEILSPDSTAHDRIRKSALYARAGVREYWIITPHPSVVEVLSLDERGYLLHKAFGKDDTLTSPAFPDLQLKLGDIFTFPLEPGEEPPAVREPPARYGRR
jgi:Uma2 family endonuclease